MRDWPLSPSEKVTAIIGYSELTVIVLNGTGRGYNVGEKKTSSKATVITVNMARVAFRILMFPEMRGRGNLLTRVHTNF
jgi:hypothetical protein